LSRRRLLFPRLLIAGVALALFAVWLLNPPHPNPAPQFDGERAYRDVLAQMALGPRTVGSEAHAEVIRYISAELERAGWQVEVQTAELLGHPIQNIIADRGDLPPAVIVGAHYDSRLFADQDPDPTQREQPVPGADDGASGVAVLLELARTLPSDSVPIELVFFDAEDNGNIAGWDWLLGSEAFVAWIETKPQAMVLVDMVGDSDLELPQEGNSDPELTASIWETAQSLGYGDVFLMRAGPTILDDHVPFIQAGIPSVDIIDIDYPYWHTSADTADKVSARSLQIVGATLLAWLAKLPPQVK
jgi:Zn-dependent M28 family amino/carboxypeptidase